MPDSNMPSAVSLYDPALDAGPPENGENDALKGLVSNIQRFSVDDGPGIRTTIFLKGCNLQCLWCHNPECIGREPELQFIRGSCVSCGRCVSACPMSAQRGAGNIDRSRCIVCGKCVSACLADALAIVGRPMSSGELLREMEKDRPFFEESGGGVTVSGGEPLLQVEFLMELLPLLKQKGFHVAVDTAGCVPFTHFQKALPYTDLFLYDIKLYTEERHKTFTGVPNKIILENLIKLGEAGGRARVRIPVIAGINDTEQEIGLIAAFLKPLEHVEKLELLPYHDYGAGKYASVGREYKLTALQKPSECFIRKAEEICARAGLNVG